MAQQGLSAESTWGASLNKRADRDVPCLLGRLALNEGGLLRVGVLDRHDVLGHLALDARRRGLDVSDVGLAELLDDAADARARRSWRAAGRAR